MKQLQQVQNLFLVQSAQHYVIYKFCPPALSSRLPEVVEPWQCNQKTVEKRSNIGTLQTPIIPLQQLRPYVPKIDKPERSWSINSVFVRQSALLLKIFIKNLFPLHDFSLRALLPEDLRQTLSHPYALHVILASNSMQPWCLFRPVCVIHPMPVYPQN